MQLLGHAGHRRGPQIPAIDQGDRMQQPQHDDQPAVHAVEDATFLLRGLARPGTDDAIFLGGLDMVDRGFSAGGEGHCGAGQASQVR